MITNTSIRLAQFFVPMTANRRGAGKRGFGLGSSQGAAVTA